MGVSRYRVSLRLIHPSMDPDEITTALQMEPKRAWKAGEPRTTPKGTPIAGVFRQTYWYANVCEGRMPPQELAEELDQVLDGLIPYQAFLTRLREEGGRSEFFVGFYLGDQAGETYPSTMLAKMAALGLDLSLDNYHDESLVETNSEDD
ncbi:DUF4279 domain-containing protein [Allomesorhizobium camelthorni]|uniref:DUF4279 domain-containing protein n=1 Tax=Allomesorhizobium camelthorni TaxID=475069 RepID=A0A6G4WAW5_9HYPH|nr:DUF4279 domain-containing protein [Mesorhizobium camelthorni]NGO51922.1 DUF4279 domain-containing protein [Mesorhizobium camelthorni]